MEVKSLRCEDLGEVLSGAEVLFVKTESDNAREEGIQEEVENKSAITVNVHVYGQHFYNLYILSGEGTCTKDFFLIV